MRNTNFLVTEQHKKDVNLWFMQSEKKRLTKSLRSNINMAVKSTTDYRLGAVLIKHASKIDLAFAMELNQYTYRFNHDSYF